MSDQAASGSRCARACYGLELHIPLDVLGGPRVRELSDLVVDRVAPPAPVACVATRTLPVDEVEPQSRTAGQDVDGVFAEESGVSIQRGSGYCSRRHVAGTWIPGARKATMSMRGIVGGSSAADIHWWASCIRCRGCPSRGRRRCGFESASTGRTGLRPRLAARSIDARNCDRAQGNRTAPRSSRPGAAYPAMPRHRSSGDPTRQSTSHRDCQSRFGAQGAPALFLGPHPRL
jgi:hypothetical protein